MISSDFEKQISNAGKFVDLYPEAQMLLDTINTLQAALVALEGVNETLTEDLEGLQWAIRNCEDRNNHYSSV